MKIKSKLSAFAIIGTIISCFLSSIKCEQLSEKWFEDDKVEVNVLNAFGRPTKDPSFNGCETVPYPPIPKPNTTEIPDEYIIDLDLPPEYRWAKVASEKAPYILTMLNSLRNFTNPFFHGKMYSFVDKYLPILGVTLPSPFKEEMMGISKATGIPFGEIVLYNIFYEVFTVCTSILAQNADGTLYHARNLDFGLFLGWDIKKKKWMTTEHLRPLVVKLIFQKGNKTLFESVNFAGYIGILTGLKPDTFTLTINERFSWFKGGYVGVIEWLLGSRDSKWLGFLTREVMENATSYKNAQKMLMKSSLLAPAYYILGGVRAGQACVITRGLGRDQTKAVLWVMGEATMVQNSTWFLVQTNYDHWEKPPFYDNRAVPAVICMNEVGNSNINFKTLYNVLSTRPVLNKLTTYTALMQVKGKMEVYLQDCEDPCWPW